MKTLIATLVSLAICLPAYAGLEESIVGLYVTPRSGKANLGTGFFTSSTGQIVTAYHVIRGANRINAVDANGVFYTNPIIEYIAPDRDLAVLQITEYPKPTTQPLSLISEIPSPSVELTIVGYPRGLPLQFVPARTTSSSFLNSLSLQDSHGVRLFQNEMDLVMLSGPVTYSGLSGAPVVTPEGVIGVFSGSYDEPGGIFWAIPSKYMADLQKIGKRPAEIANWPPTMMTAGFRSLTLHLSVNAEGEQLLNDYLESLTQYSSASEQLGSTAVQSEAMCDVLRPILEAIVADPSLSENEDAARAMLESPMEKFLTSYGAYGEAHTNLAKAGILVVTRLQNLMTWTQNMAEPDSATRRELDVRVAALINAAPSTSYYEALGDDPQLLTKHLVELGKEMSMIDEQTPLGDFVQALLRALNWMRPNASRHASIQAFEERARWLNAFRCAGSAFECIIYQ